MLHSSQITETPVTSASRCSSRLFQNNFDPFILKRIKKKHHFFRRAVYSSFDICRHCQKIFPKTTLWTHTKTCRAACENADTPRHDEDDQLPQAELPVKQEFVKQILSLFQDSAIEHICTTDSVIQTVGLRQWTTRSANADMESTVFIMTELSHLLLEYRSVSDCSNASCEIMLLPENFPLLDRAVAKQHDSTGSDKTLTMERKLRCSKILKTVVSLLITEYIRESITDKTLSAKIASLEMFVHIMDVSWSSVVKGTVQAEQATPAAMSNISMQNSMKRLRQYTLENIQAAMNDSFKYWTKADFNQLSALVVCHLILFNSHCK